MLCGLPACLPALPAIHPPGHEYPKTQRMHASHVRETRTRPPGVPRPRGRGGGGFRVPTKPPSHGSCPMSHSSVKKSKKRASPPPSASRPRFLTLPPDAPDQTRELRDFVIDDDAPASSNSPSTVAIHVGLPRAGTGGLRSSQRSCEGRSAAEPKRAKRNPWFPACSTMRMREGNPRCARPSWGTRDQNTSTSNNVQQERRASDLFVWR